MGTRDQAAEILRRLEAAGFAAYFVGGCVRDTLLGRPVHDWDITTAARPEQVLALFAHCVPTGVQHGTVTVLEGGEAYEVTTFRSDGIYLDGRHPQQVAFVPDLAGDLARRDFTVNAMAMDAAGQVTDLYGGRADLTAGILRCVGDPAVRFGEDALRMLRAVRFAAQLGFTVELETARAREACAPLCVRLSAERIRDEVEKTLLSPDPAAVGTMLRLGLLAAVCPPLERDLRWLASTPPEREVRWAGLRKSVPELDLTALRLDGRTAALCTAAALAWKPALTERELAGLVVDQGWTVAWCVSGLTGQRDLAEVLRASGRCLTLGELAVNGRDFPDLHGPAVGALLRRLLDHVLDYPQDNRRETLLTLAAQWRA